jgi:hypothetical protein
MCTGAICYLLMLYLELWPISDSTLMMLFMATFVLCFLGASLVFVGIAKMASFARRSGFRPYFVVLICIGVMGTCIFITSGLMGRTYTSEILFLYVWVTLESYVVYYALLSSRIGPVGAWVSVGVLCVSSIFGTVLYSLYFDQTGITQFLFGSLPYVNVILTMAAISLILALGGRKYSRRT